MYLPFINGLYSVAPGLLQMNKAAIEEDQRVFQIDDQHRRYIGNKENCRHENLFKYYCRGELPDEFAVCINRYIAKQLVLEHPSFFELKEENGSWTFRNLLTQELISWHNDWLWPVDSHYVTVFDALCSQVQEDAAICLLGDNSNQLAALHLCSPNYWSPADKIGKDFSAIHEIVPGMEKMRPHVHDMLKLVVNKGPFTRFAWGLASDQRLNHHPEPPGGVDPAHWYGREFDENTEEVFVRVERQSIIGFPEINAFLFTIRTYFYAATAFSDHQKKMLMTAIRSMSEQSLEYKGLSGKIGIINDLLFR